ncbi:MAG: DUF4367 domain-containing protein [Anaerotruncus massiliensis (ex Togo et al. 2019)]
MSVDAWKQGLFKMVEEKFPEYSSITYEPVDGAAGVAEFTLAEYQPAYLPDGFRLTEQMLADSINWSTYTNAEGDMISFQQSILGSGTMAINTEGSQLEEFDLGGETAYKMDNRGSQFVLWNDNQYSYMVLTNDMTSTRRCGSPRRSGSTRPTPHPPTCRSTRAADPYTPEEAAEGGDVSQRRRDRKRAGARGALERAAGQPRAVDAAHHPRDGFDRGRPDHPRPLF